MTDLDIYDIAPPRAIATVKDGVHIRKLWRVVEEREQVKPAVLQNGE